MIEIDAVQAACENRIVRMLGKHKSGVRQSKLCHLTNAARLGFGVFERATDRLLTEEIIIRATTDNSSSFLLKLTPWGEGLAQELNDTLAMQKGVVS
jgi:hypothetical protein